MRRGAWLAILFLACASPAAEDPPIVAIPNGGFEQGAEGWSFENDGGISAISTDKTSNGKRSLKVKDEDQKKGSSVLGQAVAVDGAGRYELRGKVCAISGAGLGLYVHRLDKDRNRLPADNENHVGAVDGIDAKWRPFACEFQAPKGTAFLQLWIHSYGGAEVEAYLDEFEFARLPPAEAKRPWPAQYKLAAEDQDKLTPADVLGPDGLVYPNWTRTGVQGGIPGVKVVAKLGDFGASPDDGQDDSAALQKAVDEVGAKGGGAILIPAGTWHLDGFVTIRHDGVVLRGEGREKTKLVFRYKVPEPGVAFFWPPPGAKAGPGTPFELHANPKDLQSLAFVAGGKTVAEWKRGTHSGNTFSWRRWGKHLLDAGLKGPLELQGVAEYKGGKRLETALNVELDPDVRDARLAPVSDAAIAFRGPGFDGEKLPLAKDGARGALEVELTSAGDLKPGDLILIDGPATERWKKLTRNKCPWGAYRRYEVRVEKVDGAKVTLEQPLRIEFPVVDGSWVQRVLPIRRGGVEDLYIEQQENLWISTVLFDFALECWARGVKDPQVWPLPDLWQAREMVLASGLPIRRRALQGRRRHGLRRLGVFLGLPGGESGDLEAAPRAALSVVGLGQRDPQERLPRERRAVAQRLDEREPLRAVRRRIQAGPWRLRARALGQPARGRRARPQRPAQRRLQLRPHEPARRPVDGRHERELADPAQPLRRRERARRLRQDRQFRPRHQGQRLRAERSGFADGLSAIRGLPGRGIAR
ncbi:MAG: glycoside hydrolase family 55 protein [Planctomycetota bacterium]|nr:glycoside hydrolase family 55 protein [Planctomycetota bacterium]